MAVAFRLLSPLEHRRLPWWDAPVRATGARSTVAGALVCVAGVALVLLAKNGLSGFAGWAALGSFLAAVVTARMGAGRDIREDRDVPELCTRWRAVGNVEDMLMAALWDMQWRKRRFVIAVLSTAIIFAMTLVLTGLANGLRVEANKTVDALGVDEFVVKEGASGPFVGATPFAPVDLGRIAAIPGVAAAASLVYAGDTVTVGGATRNADLFGAPEAGPGMPVTSEGRAPSTPDEVAVSSTLGLGVRDEIEIASRTLHIVGIVENSTALANLPNVFLTTAGAQQLVYGGQPLVASIGIRGTPAEVPAGYHAVDRADAIADLLRPLKVAVNSITIVAIMLWIVAALVVGSVIYLSALERLRDFAVFKAIGVPTRDIGRRAGAASDRGRTTRRAGRRSAVAGRLGRCSRCK